MNLYKTIHKLKKYQLMWQIQQAETRKLETAQAIPKTSSFEVATRYRLAKKKGDLKKQTQFAQALMDVKSFVKKDYDKKSVCGEQENKPDQSQFHTPVPSKRVGNRAKSFGAATG